MRNFIALLGILVLGLLLMGCPPGDDDDAVPVNEPTPEEVGTAIKQLLATGITNVEGAEAVTIALTGKGPEFDPCMIADVSKDNMRGVITWIDPIVAESANPDCELTLPSYPISIERCLALEDKPSPWPPVEPNATAEAAITAGVPTLFSNIDLVISLTTKPEGQGCVNAAIWKAISGGDNRAVQGAITGIGVDVAKGEANTEVPGFVINYSGCGLECGSGVTVTPVAP